MSWQDDLINKLSAARGRKISTETSTGIFDLFETTGEATARKIVRELCLADNLPSNLCGAIEKQFILLQQLKVDSENWRYNHSESSEADKYPPDVMILWGFIDEHMLWHKLGLITELYTVASMDIDSWIAKGRPIMCCKLHDTWMKGYEAAYKGELIDPECNAIAKFTKSYTEKLVAFRIKQKVGVI